MFPWWKLVFGQERKHIGKQTGMGERKRARNRNNCFSEGVSVRMGEPHCKWEEDGQSAEVTMVQVHKLSKQESLMWET